MQHLPERIPEAVPREHLHEGRQPAPEEPVLPEDHALHISFKRLVEPRHVHERPPEQRRRMNPLRGLPRRHGEHEVLHHGRRPEGVFLASQLPPLRRVLRDARPRGGPPRRLLPPLPRRGRHGLVLALVRRGVGVDELWHVFLIVRRPPPLRQRRMVPRQRAPGRAIVLVLASGVRVRVDQVRRHLVVGRHDCCEPPSFATIFEVLAIPEQECSARGALREQDSTDSRPGRGRL
mmetsp:Transcript_39649/g.97447  ORF Transcript_39649/g.97447 Transcript_39649/m.97447 type:complete len:234 (-) Transcript_39649:25-726(-)